MTIAIQTIEIRHERRLRLFFTEALTPPAYSFFSYYQVVNLDGSGPSANVVSIQALASPYALDILLDQDLVNGGQYNVTAFGGAPYTILLGVNPIDTNIEVSTADVGALVFGTDLIFSGADILEAANGDLATVAGILNWEGAMQRRIASDNPLPWKPDYGAQPANYVGGPSPLGVALKGAIIRQALSDDRTKAVTAISLDFDPTVPGVAIYNVALQPVGGTDQGDEVNLQIPVSG